MFWSPKILNSVFLMLPRSVVLGRGSCARSGMSSWVRRGPSCCGRAWCRVPYRIKVTQIWCFFPILVREQLKELTKQYEKSENDLKALQSVGQVCGRNGGRAACGGGWWGTCPEVAVVESTSGAKKKQVETVQLTAKEALLHTDTSSTWVREVLCFYPV